MTEYLGNVEIPDIVASGVFPVVPDYGFGVAQAPRVAIHQFGSGNAKIEQRFLLGTGSRRFTVRRLQMNEADRIALRNFWEIAYGPYGAFTYNAPNTNGIGTTAHTCRFVNEPLSWEYLSDCISSVGVTLIEIPDPEDAPVYNLVDTLTRFPSYALEQALLSQVQTVIPLVKIQPRESGYPGIYVSDRRCTIGEQLYQPRLVDFDGIAQGMGGESDQAQFNFGNADRVMRDLTNDVDIFRAGIEFSLFHVGTGLLLNLWKGEIVDWSMDSGPVFTVTAADGLYELTLPYPTRKISRSCWKCFDDGLGCPFTAQSTGMDTEHFETAESSSCDKGYDTPNGCLAHGMKHYFGGVLAEPQGVRIKDNSTGVWGFGRSQFTSTSIISDSIYDQVIPEIYTDDETWTDSEGNTMVGMPVNCKIAAGREESDFYQALGIIGIGPITLHPDMSRHTLDGQNNHGFPGKNGFRWVPGNDPAGQYDFFSLDAVAGFLSGLDWRKVVAGSSVFTDNFSAGVAFLTIRRTDEKGIQLSRAIDHQIQAVVLKGLQGWIWTAPGYRYLAHLTNPIWIVVNALLRARGLQFADAAACESYFDVDSAIAAAAVCNDWVSPLIGTGLEKQFKFRGVLQEQKPLRDWIQEILMNCLGYYTFAFGKLKLGVRCNSSVREAFAPGNILFNSLQLSPLKPSFNHLTANFADREYNFSGNNVSIYDVDHARLIGGENTPQILTSSMNLSGTCTKSQAARIITTRLREELGGINAEHRKAGRSLAFKTTVLALKVEPGMVCSLSHPDMPDGWIDGAPEEQYGEFRVTAWRLNKDYSIDVAGRTTVDEMYDLTVGPKPADVVAGAIPTGDYLGGVPDNLETSGDCDSGLVTMGVTAGKFTAGIYQAEFRAIIFEEDTPASVDLRTPAEGGTFADNGTTQRIITEVPATPAGAQVQLYSTSTGRWYFAARLRNLSGWSLWSDGNYAPSVVTDYIDVASALGPFPPAYAYWPMDEVATPLLDLVMPAMWGNPGLGSLGGRYLYAAVTYELAGGAESNPSPVIGPVYIADDQIVKASWRPPQSQLLATPSYGIASTWPFQDDSRTFWTGSVPSDAVRLVGIKIWHDTNINRIQTKYRLPDGSIVDGPWRGKSGGELTEINLDDDEYFIGIQGSYGSRLQQLSIVTNLTTYGPYGSAGSNPFEVSVPTPDSQHGNMFHGFHGSTTSTNEITRIGIMYRQEGFDPYAIPPDNAVGWNLYLSDDDVTYGKANTEAISLSSAYEES